MSYGLSPEESNKGPLKDKRNKILHRGETAMKDDAEECLKTAFAIVEDSIQKLGGVQVIRPRTKRLAM